MKFIKKRIHKKVYFVNIFKTKNIGDVYSSPELYFGNKFSDYEKIDLNSKHINKLVNKNVIIGGGGLFSKKHKFYNRVKKLIHKNRSFLWGVGINDHFDTNINYSDYSNSISKSVLVGCRDYGVKNTIYVPCSSCYLPIHDHMKKGSGIGHYIHYDFTYDTNGYKMFNDSKSINQVLRFLSSKETIVTNSYHGAYWSLLLGKNVVVHNEFSNKFLCLEKYVSFQNDINNIKIIQKPKLDLKECRNINDIFLNMLVSKI